MKRRIFKLCLALAALSIGCVLYGLLIEPKQLKIRQFEFTSDKYKGPDIRIGLMTDIHIGGMHVPPERVTTLVQAMNGLEPDLILIPGDFIDGHALRRERSEAFNTAIDKGLSAFSALEAPTYATIGNHDSWYDAGYVQTALETSNITVLNNQAQILSGLCLVGLEDEETGQPSRQPFAECPSDTPPFVFMHSPQAWENIRSDTVLALAGHTHGGQVNLPFIGRRVNATNLGPEHSYGFSKLGAVDFYVSSGIGTSILPVRFRSSPEIVVITLKAE